MRRTVRVLAAAIAGSSLVACAALTGLDQITESACEPGGCSDASTSRDGTGSFEGAAAEGGSAMTDTGNPEGGLGRDTGVSADAGAGADADADAGAGADADAGADSGADADSGASADSGHVDSGVMDASVHDASAVDAPIDAPEAAPTTDGSCGTVYFSDSFATTNGGWTLGTAWSIAGTCADPPTPQKGNPDPTVDHTTGAAGGIAGVFVCGDNPSSTTAAASYATSPAVDVSTAPTLILGFYRWLNSDANGWMASTVDVYDGTGWVNVYTNPSGAGNIVSDGAWTKETYDVTAYRNAAFRVRFGYAVTNSNVYSMSCWNVDDVTITSGTCP
jgi:hypothetical protein